MAYKSYQQLKKKRERKKDHQTKLQGTKTKYTVIKLNDSHSEVYSMK